MIRLFKRGLWGVLIGLLIISIVIFFALSDTPPIPEKVSLSGKGNEVHIISARKPVVDEIADKEVQAHSTSEPEQIVSLDSNVIKVRQIKRIKIPEDQLVSIIDELRKKADSGDAVAAYQLYQGLRKCFNIPAEKTALEKEVYALRNYDEGKKSIKRNPEPAVAKLKNDYSYCEGVGKSDRDMYYDYLKLAAESQLIEAQIQYGWENPPNADELNSDSENLEIKNKIDKWRSEIVKYLEAASQNGSLDASLKLGMHYYDGVIVNKDNIEAYKYIYAATKFLQLSNKENKTANKFLAMLDGLLKSAERNEAIIKAEEYLKSPNCCVYLSKS